MSVTINGSSGLTFSDGTSQNTAGYVPFRNRIINGDMRIDQRNGGASITPATSGQFGVDRWLLNISVGSKLTIQQNAGAVTPPSGFTKYLGVTTASAYTPLTNDYFGLRQSIEGVNTADFGWGTAGAQSVTVSFWVRSSIVGTFSLAITNHAYSRGYVTTYTISAANTWQYKTVTIPGDTTGAWSTDTNSGLHIFFNLGAGSGQTMTANTWGTWVGWNVSGAASIVGTAGATFYITGVQLEEGSVATPFEVRPYGTELALCQRYYFGFSNSYIWGCLYATTGYVVVTVPLPVVMRTAPTVTQTNDHSWALSNQVYGYSQVSLVYTGTTGNGFGLTGFTASAEF